MSHRHVRVQAINEVWPPGDDEGPTPPVTLDLVIDGEGRVLGRHLIFGLNGDPAVKSTWQPFVVRENGDVHFGSDGTDDDTYHRTNLREKRIMLGERFTSSDRFRRERVFRITTVVDLLNGEMIGVKSSRR